MQDLLWVEKYRPSTIGECILTDDLKQPFQTYVDNGNIPNLLLAGGAGMGKTTVAKAMCNEIGADYLVVNGSQETGIDLLRVKLDNYCSSISLRGGRKVVIIDEADYLNPQSTQPALRGFIEQYAKNCSFIFTCNFPNRLIEPIHSRCSVINFKITKKDQPKIASEFLKRCTHILKDNNIGFSEKTVAELIIKHFPDFRRIINELQKFSTFGEINEGILSNNYDQQFGVLLAALKSKKFNDVRKWVSDNSDHDPKLLYRKIYDNIEQHLEPASLANVILLLADYQYKAAFVSDHELNLTACLLEIMVEGVWK